MKRKIIICLCCKNEMIGRYNKGRKFCKNCADFIHKERSRIYSKYHNKLKYLREKLENDNGRKRRKKD